MKADKIITMITRIIGFPFFLALSLIAALKIWLTWNINYIRYGGEAIHYTSKNERKCINDIYMKLKELTKN